MRGSGAARCPAARVAGSIGRMQSSPEFARAGGRTAGSEDRIALAVVAFSAAVFVAAAPFAKTPLAPVPAFIPVYEAALVTCDVVTAALLFGQFAFLRSRALLVLAAGYLFTALVAISHALTFPGLVTPGGLLGAGPQTTAWLYMFWHGAFPLLAIAYALLKGTPRDAQRSPIAGAIAMTCGASIGAAALATLLATSGRDLLPPIMDGNRYTPLMIAVVTTVWGASGVALAVLWKRRPHSILDLWLMVVMCAWIFDIALSAVLNGGRFDLGFYAGRVYGLVAASVVLGMLLAQNARLYRRLALEGETRERDRERLVVANRELDESRAAAVESERAKGAFLATMSHEIRTPMNGLLGMLELLSLTPLDGEQRTTLGIVRDSGRSLLRIIDDILDFSKMEAGRLELRPEPTSIAALVERVRNVYSGNASSKGIVLEHRVDARIGPSLVVDPLRLQQILNNLVSNAIKFAERGRVGIEASLVERSGGRERLRFVVEDQGPGIAQEDLARLFQPFAQARPSAGGTGLGLSICRSLAGLMDGSLELESTPGVGTRAILILSLAVAEREPAMHARPGPAPESLLPERDAPTLAQARSNGMAVLVVDDHPVNRMLLARQLGKLGYAAHAACDAFEAITEYAAGGIGTVITDCNMPGMDGYELARNIRSRERRNGSRRVPIIACTANALPGDAAKCFEAGMDDYLAKPVLLEDLRRKIEHWLPAAAPIGRAALAEVSGGDAQAEREVLSQFLHYGIEDARSLRIGVASRETAQIARYAHRMKGAAGAIGASRLARACERVEACAKRGDWPGILAGMEQFEEAMTQLRDYITGLEAQCE